MKELSDKEEWLAAFAVEFRYMANRLFFYHKGHEKHEDKIIDCLLGSFFKHCSLVA
jgi:hypothetical protein